MTKTAEKLLSAAMTLNDAERAELAAKLMDSLDSATDEGYAAAWEAEIAARIRELDDKAVQPVPWKPMSLL